MTPCCMADTAASLSVGVFEVVLFAMIALRSDVRYKRRQLAS